MPAPLALPQSREISGKLRLSIARVMVEMGRCGARVSGEDKSQANVRSSCNFKEHVKVVKKSLRFEIEKPKVDEIIKEQKRKS